MIQIEQEVLKLSKNNCELRGALSKTHLIAIWMIPKTARA